jgi:protein SCO1/2
MMDKGWRSVLAVLAILIACSAVFYSFTRGFRAVTADGARQIDLMEHPRAVTPLALVDQGDRRLLLSALPSGSAEWTVATLVYTHCITICRTSASGLAYIQAALGRYGLSGKVQLLTLSFDPARDTPAVLARYARGQGAQPGIWQFATVADRRDLAAMLKLFGIVVLPDGLGGYTHNAALFLIDGNGRLVRAYDVDRPDSLLADLVQAEKCCG